MKNQNKYTQQQKDCLDRINNLYNQLKEMSEEKNEEIIADLYVTDDIDYILDLLNNFHDDPDKKTSAELLSFLGSETEDKEKCPLVYLISKNGDTEEMYYIIIIKYEGKLHLACCTNLKAICAYLADKSEYAYEFHMKMFNQAINQNNGGEGSSEK